MKRKAALAAQLAAFIILVLAYSWLPRQGFTVWNSPDENAVAFASQPQAAGFGLYTPSAAGSDAAGGLAHPRSFTVADGRLVPVGFVGWPWLLRLLRETPVGFLWPFAPAVLAALGVFALQYTVQTMVGKKAFGWVVAALLAVHPAWWYFANRGLLPNVAFVSILLISLAGAVRAMQGAGRRQPWWQCVWCAGAGIAFGVAMALRPSEAIWMLPVAGLFGMHLLRSRTAPMFITHRAWCVAAGLGGLLAAATLFLGVNAAVYGRPFTVGYTLASDALPPISLPGYADPMAAERAWWAWLAPFGFHEMNTLRNVWHYLGLPWWFTLWGIAGVIGVWKSLKGRHAVYALAAIYLFVLYGSWNLTDNPTPGEITIGVSYMRYWLPIFVGLALAGGWAMWRGSEWVGKRWGNQAGGFFLAALLACSAGLGWWQTFSGMEGLWAVRHTLAEHTAKQEALLAVVPPTGLVLTIRDDKWVFPSRAVVAGFLEPGVQARLGSVVHVAEQRGREVFYAGPVFSPGDEAHIANNILAPQGLHWTRVHTADGWGVWKLIPQ
jgi:hypothetical protein